MTGRAPPRILWQLTWRLAVQLSHASQVGRKIVSWEVPYFSPLAGERGLKLRRDYLASLAAGDRE